MFSKYTKDALDNLKNEVVKGLKEDGLKWFKPFLSFNTPKNAITLKEYSGINFWTLNMFKRQNEFEHNLYATRKAWLTVGGTIKEGFEKKARAIFYYSSFNKKVENNKNELEDKTFKFLKVSYVYNVSQINLSKSTYKLPDTTPINKVVNNDEIEQFVKNIEGLNLEHKGNGRCYYDLFSDKINMSDKICFIDNDENNATGHYYSTLFHELIHWTGAENRLKRFEKNKKRFKDDSNIEYAHEELIAELGAVLMCRKFNLEKSLNRNSLSYLKTWISRLENDNKFLISALTQSYKAHLYLIEKSKIQSTVEIKKVA